MADSDVKFTVSADTGEARRELTALEKEAKRIGRANLKARSDATPAFSDFGKSVQIIRRALTGFGVAGLFTSLIAGISKIRSSFDDAKKSADEFSKIQNRLAESKGVQRMAADYAKIKDAVQATVAARGHELDMVDEDVKTRRRLDAAGRAAAKDAELSALDSSDPAYLSKKLAIEERYARQSAMATASDAREDVTMQRQRLAQQAQAKADEAKAEDANAEAIRSRIRLAQREQSAAAIAANALNRNDKTNAMDAVGITLKQFFTGDWGRMAMTRTAEGDAERKAAAEKAAAAEMEIARLQEELRASAARAEALRKEAGALADRRDKAGDALAAIEAEKNNALQAASSGRIEADNRTRGQIDELNRDSGRRGMAYSAWAEGEAVRRLVALTPKAQRTSVIDRQRGAIQAEADALRQQMEEMLAGGVDAQSAPYRELAARYQAKQGLAQQLDQSALSARLDDIAPARVPEIALDAFAKRSMYVGGIVPGGAGAANIEHNLQRAVGILEKILARTKDAAPGNMASTIINAVYGR